MSKLKELLEQIEIANRRHSLFKEKDTLVVGVSGGPDSIALLTLLEKLRRKYALTLHAAHLNHGLLKRESKKYQRLTQETAGKLGIPFHCKGVALRKLAKIHKRSIEEMGRLERYRFFEEVARKTRAQKIVTAHTLDDQAETMLLRLLRGTGLKGLIGISTKRKQGAFEVIRPLLSCKKENVLTFLRENKIPFLNDKTNRDPVFTRNRVRHQLLPVLEKFYNPQIKQSLASLQFICSQTQDYVERVSWRAFRRCSTKPSPPQKAVLKISPLQKLHPAIAQEVILRALAKTKGDLKKISYPHISAIMDILRAKEKGLECHLPGSLIARKKRGVIEFLTSGKGGKG